MPYVGVGLHFLIALFFAVHVVRTQQAFFWLLILFSFPLLGSVVYFFAIYLPQSRLERGVNKAARAAVRILDPERELREAREAFDLSPSAQNQWRIATALLARGETAAAVQQFDAVLRGPLGRDPDIRLAAARARLKLGDPASAVTLLQEVRADRSDFRPEEIGLALGEALAAAGRNDEARGEFATAVERFGSIEARGQYALWAASVGDIATARTLRDEIEQARRHWTRHTRDMNEPLIRRIDAALDAARR